MTRGITRNHNEFFPSFKHNFAVIITLKNSSSFIETSNSFISDTGTGGTKGPYSAESRPTTTDTNHYSNKVRDINEQQSIDNNLRPTQTIADILMGVKSNTIERTGSGSSSGSGAAASSSIKPRDVLCGRGGLTNSHVGNKNFRKIIAEYQAEYLGAKKKEKKEIAKRIVDRIQRSGGRFLKRSADSHVWSEVTEKKALEKTSQALREGLDVRRKTVRPEKLYHELDNDDRNPRKRPRLVEGLVMESPQLTGMSPDIAKSGSGDSNDMPDLKDEMGGGESPSSRFEPLFNFNPCAPGYPLQYSADSFENVEQI
jgi:hypothetical protein